MFNLYNDDCQTLIAALRSDNDSWNEYIHKLMLESEDDNLSYLTKARNRILKNDELYKRLYDHWNSMKDAN